MACAASSTYLPVDPKQSHFSNAFDVCTCTKAGSFSAYVMKVLVFLCTAHMFIKTTAVQDVLPQFLLLNYCLCFSCFGKQNVVFFSVQNLWYLMLAARLCWT